MCMYLLCDQDCHIQGVGSACYKQGPVPVILCMCYFVTFSKSLSSFDGKHLGDCYAAAHPEPCGGKLKQGVSRVLCGKPALERNVCYFWIRHS